MKKVFNRILIFDGSYCLHRNLSVPNNWEMINNKNKRTGGIFGVLRTIAKELKTYNFYPVVIFDAGLSQRRLSIYPNYKRAEEKVLLENKEKTELDLLDEEFKIEYNTQRNDLIQLLPLFGIPVIRIENWEGDDLIYILSKITENSIVVSDDKDLIQLLKDPSEDDLRKCRIRRPLREEFIEFSNLKDHNYNSINEFIGCKSIIGDPSDNLPSACFQVGEKTSLGLLQLYENCLNHNINFPTNENELDILCKKFNISKRKAYLNFNENQFLNNLLLTDLSLVDQEITNELLNYIYNTILLEKDNHNKNQILNILEDLEIKSFNVDQLFEKVLSLKDTLLSQDKEKVKDLKEINPEKTTLF